MFKPIYWHQGLFLKPHHFQHLYARQQEENYKLRESLDAFFWGFSKINIDKKELLNGNFMLSELEAVFVDGTFVEVPSNAIVASRSFREKFDETQNNLTIYVGIKSFRKDIPNVTQLDNSENLESVETRFVTNSEASSVNNLYHKDESAEIQFLNYHLKIFFEDEIKHLNGYEVMPVAKVKQENQQFILCDDFVPPVTTIEASDTLFSIVKATQKDITSHLLQLQEYKLPANVLLQEPNYLKYLMALQSLSPYLVRLNHMISLYKIPPHKFYELFVELIALLSSFSERVDIFGKLKNGKALIAGYKHLDIYRSFNDVTLLIQELLDVIILGPDYILPFIKNDTTFSLDCPVSIFQAHYRYFLVVKTPTQKEKLQDAFVEFAKIASSSEIDTIVERSLRGLEFRPYDMPIQGLPQREDSNYYELMTDDTHWRNIQQMQNITIEFDEATDDMSIELVVVKS